ncbi:MAG TPA: ferritin-like domain-containing protein [Longimicrobiales bacterium]|nr:ferritin-like domain-containing protein [Longimicrobiales bacterium]
MNRTMDLLQEARRRELEQAHFYRALSGDAEHAGDAAVAERLNELLADEQHHVARLAARILELGGTPQGDGAAPGTAPLLDAWEPEARRREEAEVAWYEAALGGVEDPGTRVVLGGILESERHHRETLAGKWMPAGPTTTKESM